VGTAIGAAVDIVEDVVSIVMNESSQGNQGSETKARPKTADEVRVEGQRERRRERRERESRETAVDQAGNRQKPSGEGFRDHESANKGPKGERPKGPDRRHGRERNVGIEEEHSMKPKTGGYSPQQ
jgi:hypothetical protein